MERSQSSASNSTQASYQHTRNTSSIARQQQHDGGRHSRYSDGSRVVSLFVTNLRLLNFDLLPNWPGITVASLGNQDARARLRNTEFALYQLFRIYDPPTTADKLQPFFPPLEPLQSINLRAALYRCLNELKKNGVLGKETVLRKTMLDECQGEKFWELCLSFSAIVLRKVTMEKKSRYGRSQTERLGISQAIAKSQKESMLPLAIAHKSALFRVLEEKQQKQKTYGRLYDVLVEKENDLWQRRAKAEDDARVRLDAAHSDDTISLERGLGKAWVGNPGLREALISGDDCSTGDSLLIKSFDDLWRRSAKNEALNDENQVGLLGALEHMAGSQSQRLRKWQSLHEKLLASKSSSKHESLQNTSGLEYLHFDRHSNLKVRDQAEMEVQRSQPQAANTPRHASATQYEDILTAMREELRRTRKTAATASPPAPHRSSTAPAQPARKPSVTIDTGAGALRHHKRTPSQTAVPVRPPMGRRAPSRSRSYQQPKVDSQRQPIPLKAELFSPLKSSRRSSQSPSLSSMLPSPVEEPSSPGAMIDGVVNDSKRASHGTFDSGVSLGIDNTSSSESSHENSDHGPENFKIPCLPPPKPRHAARPSLAERARMSMAFNSSDETSAGFLPSPLSDDQPPPPLRFAKQRTSATIATTEEQDSTTRTSLLDRTRQSISLAPQQPMPISRKKPASHSRSRTSMYPINQFDTPKKPRSSSLGVGEDDESGGEKRRVFTPRETLFSPDAEYDSVFKPRPKVAKSPVMSPEEEAGVDSNRSSVAMAMAMGEEEEVGHGSPLGVRGR